MSNPNMQAKVKEPMELKRMKEETKAEIAAEYDTKAVMDDEETLFAGAFKISRTPYATTATTCRFSVR